MLLLWIIWACSENQNAPDQVTCALSSPSAGLPVSNNQEVELQVTTSEAVLQVEFFLDGIPIGTVYSEPYILHWTPANVGAGNHQVTCTVVPHEGENAQDSINLEFILNLGDIFRGGMIFYLDETGEHGLVASTNDVSLNNNSNFIWSGAEFLGATDTADGKGNTGIMAEASSGSEYAGYAFKNGFEFNGYTDWYIPARAEMRLLMKNQGFVGEFPSLPEEANYWSSTECCRIKACAVNMVYLTDTITNKVDHHYRIRPVRKF